MPTDDFFSFLYRHLTLRFSENYSILSLVHFPLFTQTCVNFLILPAFHSLYFTSFTLLSLFLSPASLLSSLPLLLVLNKCCDESSGNSSFHSSFSLAEKTRGYHYYPFFPKTKRSSCIHTKIYTNSTSSFCCLFFSIPRGVSTLFFPSFLFLPSLSWQHHLFLLLTRGLVSTPLADAWARWSGKGQFSHSFFLNKNLGTPDLFLMLGRMRIAEKYIDTNQTNGLFCFLTFLPV